MSLNHGTGLTDMSKVRVHISVSADGYVAGPNQSEANPLGEGGESLHDWVVRPQGMARAARQGGRGGQREQCGARGGDCERRRRDHGPREVRRRARPWGDDPWRGWWGDDPPFHMPVFVLTHHEREPLTLSDTTFTFVTDGIESALDQAKAAAGRQGRHDRRRSQRHQPVPGCGPRRRARAARGAARPRRRRTPIRRRRP